MKNDPVTDTMNTIMTSISTAGVAKPPVATFKGELTYDSRSEIYKAIERADWDAVVTRAGTNPEETQVWHKKYDPDSIDGGAPILPIHLAMISGAPKVVFDALLDAHPKCVKSKDDEGRLPLHLELDKNSPDFNIVDVLISIYPEACKVKSKQGKLAVTLYGKKMLQLFRYIELKKWKDAILQVNSHPEEASTWIFRKEKNGKIRWRLTPLHAVIIYNGPIELVQALVDIYPAALKKPDDEGMLPVHLAFRNGMSNDIICLLLDAYPDAVEETDSQGRVPIQHARTITRDRKELVNFYANTVAKLERDKVSRKKDEEYKKSLTEKIKSMEEVYETKRLVMISEYESTLKNAHLGYATKHALAMAEVNKKHSSSMVEMKVMHNTSLEHVSKKHQESLKGVDAKYAETITDVDKKIEASLGKEHKEHQASLAALKTEFDASMEQSKKEHDEAIGEVRKEQRTLIEATRKQYEESIAKANEEHESELNVMQSKIDHKDMVNKEWEAKVTRLEKTVGQLNCIVQHNNGSQPVIDDVVANRSYDEDDDDEDAVDTAGEKLKQEDAIFFGDKLVEISAEGEL